VGHHRNDISDQTNGGEIVKKLYACPGCGEEHSGIALGYEDGSGDYGDGLSPIFDCWQCGKVFTEGEGFIGWEGQPDDNPSFDIPFSDDDDPSGNPDLNVISGGYDR